MKHKILSAVKWLLPIALAAAGIFLRSSVPTGFLGLCCFGLAGLLCLYFLIGLLARRELMTAKVLRSILLTLICFSLVLVTATGLVVAAAGRGQAQAHCACIVVLGAKVNGTEPSRILAQRIDAAEAYLHANPDSVAVLSGGQGADEGISEAQCMCNVLTQRGIAPERLLLEESSTSTMENLQFSLELLEKTTGSRPETVGVVSSEFHLFRAAMYARGLGIRTVGIPGRTDNPIHFVNYFLREIAGVWHYIILGG